MKPTLTVPGIIKDCIVPKIRIEIPKAIAKFLKVNSLVLK